VRHDLAKGRKDGATLVASFDPKRFDNTVPHYVKHRLRYDDQLICRICAEAGLDQSCRALDLGCGPGFITNQLAPFASDVIGIDPSNVMLEAAQTEAKARGLNNVAFYRGSSFDLSIVEGPFQLITMGRSFHWMDRLATLVCLKDLLTQDGCIALLSDEVWETPQNEWWQRFSEICDSFGEASDFMPRNKDWEPHVVLLMRSAFSDVQTFSQFKPYSWTIDDLLGLALSRSTMNSCRFGPKKAAFETMMRDTLAPYVTDRHQLESFVEQKAIIARRP